MIAYHYGKTDEHDEAIPWLERAGDRAAAIYASETAITTYQETRRRLEQLGGREQDVAWLDEKLGCVLHMAGRYDEAISFLENAIDVYGREQELNAAGRATATLGMVHRFRGTPEEGIGRVQPMIDLLAQAGPSPALASLHIALAHLFFLMGKYREQMAAAERGAHIAATIGDDRLLGEAEMRRGTALDNLGDPEESRRVMEAALPLVEAGGDLLTLFITLNNLGFTLERLGRMDQARLYAERALEVTEQIGNPDRICFALGNLGGLLTMVGDWRGAHEALERAMALAGKIGRLAPDVATPLYYLGQLSLWEGDWEAASRHLREALALTEEMGDRQVREIAQALLADLDVLEGRPHQAVARLEPLIVREGAELAELLPALTRAGLAVRDDAHIRRAAEAAEKAVMVTRNHPGLLPDALCVQGMVFTVQGRLDDSHHVLTEGLARARSLPYPYIEARILVQLARLCKQRKEPDQERGRLAEALAIFRRLGAKKDVQQTERVLETLERD